MDFILSSRGWQIFLRDLLPPAHRPKQVTLEGGAAGVATVVTWPQEHALQSPQQAGALVMLVSMGARGRPARVLLGSDRHLAVKSSRVLCLSKVSCPGGEGEARSVLYERTREPVNSVATLSHY